MKNIVPLVASFLLFSVSVPNGLSALLHDPEPTEPPGVSTSPPMGIPAPTRMACSLGGNANDDYIATTVNTPVTFSPLSNDDDTPQQNFGGITSSPQHGTAERVGIDAIKYTPAAGYTGSDSFTYLHIGCMQCSGGWCSEPTDDTATVYITVTN